MKLLRRLAIAVVVLGVIVVIADVAARSITERRAAAQLQTIRRLPERPTVNIGGLSFLDQALRGTFDSVSVTTGEVPPPQPSGLALSAVDARLDGVTVPLADVLSGKMTALPVDDVAAKVKIAFTTLVTAVSAQLPQQVSDVRLTRTSSGQLLVHGKVSALGVAVDLEAAATLAVRGSDLVVTVPAANLTALPEAFREQAAQLLTTKLVLPVLPDGLTITGVSVEPDDLAFAVAGRNVQLHGR